MGSSSETPIRVLVVDDSALVREIVAMTLRQMPALWGCTIDQAPDGQAALDKLKEHRYSIVLADVQMPRLNGIDLVRRVRQELGDTRTPIVLVTTLGSDADVQRGMDAGATAYIAKPLSPYRIKRVVGELMRNGRCRTG